MNFKPNMLFLNRSFDKKRLKALLLWFRLNLSENAALKAVEILQGLGFRSATQGAISLGLDDLKTPTSKGGRVFQAQVEVALAHHEHHRGNRTPVELFQHLVDTWHRTSQDLTTEVVQLFHSTERVNPVYMMAFSGARGNISQVRQLVGMRGLMADPRGQIVGFPILSNFREGLTITEYFVSCYGARKGVVDTAIRTADAGYLTRRLADVSHHVVVRTTNCGTHESILLRDIKEGQKTILSLANRLVGRVLAEHIFLPTSPGSDSMIGFIDEVDRFVSKGKPNPNYGEPAPPVLSSSFADPISKAELRTSTERKPIDFVNKPLPQRNTGALLTSDREPAPPSETRGSGLPIVYVSKGSKALLNIEDVSKVRDRVKLNFVQSAKTIIYRNSEITSSLASKLAEHYLEIPVRSPLSCSLPWGVCQLCYGWGLSEGRRVTLGEAVGIIAAQSIGEPGTQLTLRTFHTGGVFSGELLNEIRSPYNGTVIFPTPLQGLLLRTPHGQIAFLTKVSGKMKISETEVHFASKIEDLDLSKSIDCIDEVIGFSSKAKGELAPHNAEQEKTDNFVKKSIDFVDKSFALQRRSLPSQAKKNIGVDTSTNCFEGEAVRSSALLKGSLSKEAEESVADKLTGQINGQALRSKVLPKQDSEFCIQPSTVIFVKQKEHVINNQLLAEFSASTLQSVNDQIEITQQVLSETAGQIWFKEIEYGNRKGPGSGSLGTYFSSQKLGGIWVLAGKPTASSNPIIDTNYYNPLTNIEDVSKAKKCYANPSLAPRACQTYSFDEWQRDKVSDREPLLCLTSSNIEDVKSAKPCSILSVSSKPVALQEGTHALLKGSLQKPVVSPGDVGCTQRVKKQETDLINWDLSNKPLKSFIPLVIIMRGKQRFSLRSRGTCKTQNGVNETIKINLVVSKKPITASINLSTSSIDNPSNEPLITPYASSSIHLFKVIAKNTKTNILGKTTILLHEKGENKTNFHKNCNTHLVFNNFVLSNFSKFPKINELPLKRKYLFKYHTFGIQHRLKRSINTRYTKTSTPPIIYLQNNSGVLKYNYVLGYSQAISSNRHTLRSNGGADSLSNISVASFVSRGEAVRSSALLNGSLSKAVTPSIYVSYEVAKMNLLGVNKVVLGQLNSKEKIANHLVLLTSSALRTNTNISNIEDVTPLGNASLTSYLLVVRSKKKPITSPINRCEAQGESERAPYEMLGQDVKEVKKRVSIPLTTELGQGVQFSQGKRRLTKTPVYTFQSGCPNVNHVAKPFDKFGALSAYYMKSSNSFFEKTKIRLCVPSEAKRYFSFARHAYDISNAKHLKNSTLVYPESLYSKEVSSSKNKFTFMQGKTRRSSKKLDMLPLLSETDLVTFAYRAKLKGVGHKRDFIVKKSSFGVRDNSIALPPLPVLPSLAPYFNKTSFSFSASLASFNASLNSKSADFVDVFTKVKSFDKEPFSKAWVPLSKATGFEETDNTEQGFADLTSSMLEDVKQSKGSLSETYPSVMSVDCFMSQGQKSSYFVTEKRRLQGTWIQKKRAYLTYLNQICSIPFTRLFTKGYKAEAFTNFISRTNLQLSRFCVPQSTTLISDTVQNKKGGLALYRSAKQSVELKSNSPFLATQRTNILSLRSTNIEDVTQRGRDVRSKGGAVLSSALLKGSLSNSYFLHRTNISNIEDVSASRAKQGQDVKDVRNVKNTPITSSHIFPGQLVAYGDNIASNVVTTESGQVLYIDSEKTTVRKAQTVLIYSQAIIAVLSGDWIKKGTPLMSLSYQKLVTGDIVQGLPKIEQFFEAPVLRDGTFWSDSLQAKLNQFFQEEREKSPLAEAVRKSFSEIQRVLVEGVLRVYISQGVLIADKHLEVIVRQMTCKGRILYSGDTGFLRNELVSLDKIENVNQVTYGQKALYHPQVRGITDASLESESFLSAASFQETTRVLSRDAIIGKTDLMRGLKERVIVGELIQAGTGLANNSVYNFLTPSFS